MWFIIKPFLLILAEVKQAAFETVNNI